MAVTEMTPRRAGSGPAGQIPGQAGSRTGRAALPCPAVLYLLVLFLPTGFKLGLLAMNPLRLVLLVMVVPLTLRPLMGKYGPVRLTDVLFLVYLMWVTVALAVNNPNMVVRNSGSTSIEFIPVRADLVEPRARTYGRKDSDSKSKSKQEAVTAS